MDIDSGALLFFRDDKGAEALKSFQELRRRSPARIQAAADDVDAVYIGAVLGHLPETPLVFDHLHVGKLVNNALTQIRYELHH